MQALRSAAGRWRVGEDAVVADAVLAAMLLAAALGALATVSRDGSPVVATGSCVLMAGAVAVRRRVPLAAALAALAGLVGYVGVTHDPGAFPPVAVLLTFYTLGRSGAWRRRPARTGCMVATALAGWAVITADLHSTASNTVSSWLVVAVVPLVVGVGVARRTALGVQLSATAAQLRAEQEFNAARATVQERNRVARDLHDVVAHCVSVMVVQAGAARLVAGRDPAAADQALAVIGGCGRDALADLRRIVGVLRRDTDPDFGSGAGLADLDRLADRLRAAGLPIQRRVAGDTRLPPAVDVVVYRVVQEALTNVVKHAGAGATAEVQVKATPTSVSVEVTNTAGAGPQGLTPSGHGLIGMQARVTAQGGDLWFGSTPAAGFTVQAQIPLDPTGAGRGAAPRLEARRFVRLWHTMPNWAGDAVIVLGWFAAMEWEAASSSARRGPWLLNAAAVAVMALAAWWRRRNPLVFFAVVGAFAVVLSGGLTSLDRSTLTGLYVLAVPMFSVAAWQPRSRAALGFTIWSAVAIGVAVTRHAAIDALTGAWVMGLVVWTAGRIWRAQRILTADLTETTARLTAEREHRADLAVATERTRIARELHGLVAHGVVSMVVQAEAARNLLTHEPASADRAIRAIEQTGRDALMQLRRILGVLRSTDHPPTPHTVDDAPARLVPQPAPTATPPPQQVLI